MHKLIALVVCAILAAWVAPPAVRAEGPPALLSGTVVDASGGALSQVTITLIDAARAVQRDAITNAHGTFTFVALAPGRYVLRADHRSFTPAEIRDLELHAGDRLSIRVEMQLHGVSEHLAVRAPASRVRTSGGAIGAVFDRQLIEELPANGGSLQALIALAPGVVTIPGATANTIDLSVNGQRTSTNYFMVDGVGANIATPLGFSLRDSQAMGGALPALTLLGTTTSLVSLDALDEVRVQTSSYAAEFGRQPGAQVSLTTRAGTNTWHGSLFAATRHEALDARDWFANRAGRSDDPPLRHQQAGGSIGGPLKMPGYDGRDRTFFFLSHETVRQREDGVLLTELPLGASGVTLDMPRGPTTPPSGLRYPNRYEFAEAFDALRPRQAVRGRVDAISLRLDQRVASTMSLFGRVQSAPSAEDSRFDPIVRQQRTRLDPTAVTLGGSWATRRASHDLRLNYARHTGTWREDRVSDLTARPFPLGLFLVGTLGGSVTMRVRQLGGASEAEMPTVALSHAQEQINGVLTTTMIVGAHQMKIGADYRQLTPSVSPVEYGLRVNERQSDRAATDRFAETRVTPGASLRPRFTNLSLFAQDAWRISPRLSVDAGLRWEVNPAPRASGAQFPYMPADVEPDGSSITAAPVGARVWKTRYSNVAPRLGAAWLLDGRQGREMALRGGGGVFYDLGSSQNANAYHEYGHRLVYTLWQIRGMTAAREPIYAPPIVAVTQLPNAYGVDHDLSLPYSVHWQLSLERALGATRSVTLSYVGAAGRRLLAHRLWDLTPRIANTSPPRLDVTTNHAESDYRAIQVQIQQRLWRGLGARAAYTWSHATDLASIESGPDAIALLVRGDADFDRRHVLNAAFGYALPAVARVPVARTLLRDWGVDGRLLVQSGAPVPVFGTEYDEKIREAPVWPARVDGVPLYIEDANAPGGRRINRAAFTVPEFRAIVPRARNVARGPRAWQMDLALRRRITLRGPVTLQVRLDAFNVFNHPNFGSIDGDLDSPFFGEPRAMLGRNAVSLGSPYAVGRPRSIELGFRLGF